MQDLHSLLIINNDRISRSTLENLLARCRRPLELSANSVLRDDGMKRLASDYPPQLVILEVTSIAQGILDVSSILTSNPRMVIIAISVEKRPDWTQALIKAGVDEYLAIPVTTDGVEYLLERAAQLFEQKQGADSTGGKVVCVYNPSGGMGTTTIAVNLAAALALKGEIAALVDLNPFSSDVAAFLNLNPAYTLSAIQDTERRMNASRLMNIMTRHSSGVQVLCGPEETGVTVEITPDRILTLLTLMRSQFSVTVFDAAGVLSDRNMETFGGSDVILYPLLLLPPAIKNARRYLNALSEKGLGPDRVKVLVNRHSLRDDEEIADAEKFLGIKVFHTIPNSYPDIKKSIYNGSPIVTTYPRSPVTASITELTWRVTAELSSGSAHAAEKQRRPL